MSEDEKKKWKQHKYNHRTSRKGYANLMEELKALSSNPIDRSLVWKQAHMDRKGQIPNEEMKEVVNLIMNITKDDEQLEGVTLEKMKVNFTTVTGSKV
ncbi:uncharacterized protein E6C27_scaffold417G00310 [Cucumis melo var. makuwa]|uniref:Uncharacterized protein n=1 Tax=Cucumis melo var. makuwa TaxID=1194695 RepID=A0A5A7SH23_CUCMM|nr:uncharacterized protein E6C27_scaffold417G00310 [Cucumis melo var. makuwa]